VEAVVPVALRCLRHLHIAYPGGNPSLALRKPLSYPDRSHRGLVVRTVVNQASQLNINQTGDPLSHRRTEHTAVTPHVDHAASDSGTFAICDPAP